MPYKPDGSPPLRGRCPKDREGLDYEKQRFVEDYHPDSRVHPDGSVDCFGNHLMYERCDVKDPSDSPVEGREGMM